MLMAVPVDAGQSFTSGTPSPLFQIRGRAPISSTDLVTYDVSRDGSRILANTYVKPQSITPLTVIQNALGAAAK